ncbi:diguanylate cyclase domain-containing protein [Mycolicibacterium fortuitum]
MGHGGQRVDESAERRFRQLIDHCPDAIVVHQHGKLVYINNAGVRWMAAQTAEQLVGYDITRFVHPDSIGPMLSRIHALRHEGDVSAPSEAKMLRFDGATLDVEAVSVLTTWDGAPAYQVIFRDVTAHKAAQATLRYQAALVDHASDAIIATTGSGVVTSWNRAAEAIYRYRAEHALGRPVSDLVGAPLNPADILNAGGMTLSMHRAQDGSRLFMRVSAAAMEDGFVLLCSDQTAVRRAEQHFQAVVSSLEEGVIVIDRHGRPKTANPAAHRILGIKPGDLLHGNLNKKTHTYQLYDTDGQQLANPQFLITETLRTGQPITGHIIGVGIPDRQRIWLSVNCRLLNPLDPADRAILISFSDVTEQRSATERLAYQAAHDPLTELPNRAHIEERIARLQQAGETPAAVLFIDLDDFKKINDSLGHEAGDNAIRITAQRLRSAVRDVDIVGRLGGDEFIVLLTGELSRTELQAIADRILESVGAVMVVAGAALRISASIGIVATGLDKRRDITEMLRHADLAMYTAKAQGRHTRHFFDEPTEPHMEARPPAATPPSAAAPPQEPAGAAADEDLQDPTPV